MEQLKTYQTRQNIKRSIGIRSIEKFQWIFILDFIKKNKRRAYTLLLLLSVQAFLEVVILVFASNSLRDRAYTAFLNGSVLKIFLLILLGVSVYLVVSFFSLKAERQFVLDFINKIRRSWFIKIFNMFPRFITNERKADFIAKASYHFPLISLGVDSSAMGVIRWFICVIVLIVVGSLGGGFMFGASVAIIILSLLVGFIAYFIANHYISQEVASYSQVMRHIDNSLSEFSAIKVFSQQESVIKDLDSKVSIDTYFRVRRDVWLRYFNKAIFGFVFIFSFLFIIFGFYKPDIFLRFYANNDLILFAILSIYSLRTIYESGRAGLYIPPLRLGISLSIPKHVPKEFIKRKNTDWSHIEFRSNKTKLYIEGEYFKNVSVSIEKGKRYLFFGEPYSGKTSLAELISGEMKFNQNGWLVKIDEIRLPYRYWIDRGFDNYFVSNNFSSEKTIGEIIFGKDKLLINSEDIYSVYKFTDLHPTFSKVLSGKRFVGESIVFCKSNPQLLFALHVLHCLVTKPSLITIDNQWVDLNYPEILDLLSIMERELKDSAIVIFSRTNNDIIKYNNKYEIKNREIQGK